MDKKDVLYRIKNYCQREQFDEAIAIIDELIEGKSNYLNEAIVLVISSMNENKKELDKTYLLIQKGLSLFPDDTSINIELCLNLHLRNFRKEALDLCRKLTHKFPLCTELWYLLAELYDDCKDYAKAVEAMNFAISSATEDDSELHFHLILMKAQYLFKNESYVAAIDCFTELKSYKEYDKALIDPRIAECYMHTGDYESAFDLLNGVFEQKKMDSDIAYYGKLIYCCLHTDRQMVAADLLTEALKLHPNRIFEYLDDLYAKKQHKSEIINTADLVKNFLKDNTHIN